MYMPINLRWTIENSKIKNKKREKLSGFNNRKFSLLTFYTHAIHSKIVSFYD